MKTGYMRWFSTELSRNHCHQRCRWVNRTIGEAAIGCCFASVYFSGINHNQTPWGRGQNLFSMAEGLQPCFDDA